MNEPKQISLPEPLLRAGFSLQNGTLHLDGGPCMLTEPDIPEGVQGIRSFCFSGSPVLKSVRLPKSLRELGTGAFADCPALETVLIPEGITRLRKMTFSGCRALRSVELPHSVTSIGEWAFRSCHALETVLLPESVTDICAEVFLDCPALTILGRKNSAAERFAQTFGIPFQAVEQP
jgi:hypothetical protein